MNFFDLRIYNVKGNKMFFAKLYSLKNEYNVSVYDINTLSNELREVPEKIMLDFCRTEKQYNYDAEICLTIMLAELRRMYVGSLKRGQISCPEIFKFTYKGQNYETKKMIKDLCVSKFEKLNSLIGKIVFIFDDKNQQELISNIIFQYYKTLFRFLKTLRNY